MWMRVIVLALFCCAASLHATAAELWRPIGPGAGIPAHVVADPFAPGRLYALWGEPEQVYRRDSRAASWSYAGRGLEGSHLMMLAFHPTRPGTLWVTAEADVIYRSTDGGASWQRRFSTRSGRQVFGLWPIPHGRDAILLGSFGFSIPTAKLYRSRNGGQSWAAIDGTRGPVAALPATQTAFALGTDGRALLVTRDAGASWTPSGALPVDADDEDVLAFVAVPGGRGRRPVLLVSFAQSGLFRSIDQGATWSLVGPAGPGPSSVVALPRALFAAFANGLHISSDHGATWQRRPSASFPPGPVSLAADPAGTLYAVAPDAGELFQSQNGGRAWTRIAPRGVQQFVALDFAWHPLDARVQAFVSGQLPAAGSGFETIELRSSGDGGATWRSSPFEAFAFDPTDPHVLYGGSAAGVAVTRDGGATWTGLRAEPAKTLAHSGAALFAAGCGIARSEDGGGQWTEVLHCEAPPSPHLPNGGFLLPTRLVPHPTDPDVLWAEVTESVTIDGYIRSVLYGSFDGGDTWQRRDLSFRQIALAPGQPDTIWGLGGVVERSDDRGLTWRVVRYLSSEDTFDLEVDPLDANRIYLVGFFAEVSQDGGATWDFAFDVQRELAAWGPRRQKLTRLFLHPTAPGRIAVTPGLGLLLRRAPL